MTTIIFPEAPGTTFTYCEILVKYAEQIPKLFQLLTPEERIFVYYLYRASIPGDRILSDQLHRYSLEAIDFFTKLKSSHSIIVALKIPDLDGDIFMRECEMYLVYLICNHGFYFNREHANNKRTPERLGMKQLTFHNLQSICKVLDPQINISHLEQILFDSTYEATGTVPGKIEESGSNFYAKGFTEADFQKLPLEDQSKINAYFYRDEKDGRPRCMPYCVTGKFSSELKTSVYWMQKAHAHAQNHPKFFDQHLVSSLALMIEYLKTGDETVFKKHCVDWLQSKSRIDYCAGFQEVYDDPKSYRGAIQYEVTMKTLDMEKLNLFIPEIEKQLPFPKEFLRDLKEHAPVMNASMNMKLFGTGHLGSFSPTAAYCLPNYEEIREQVGSKQIIYPSTKAIGMMKNKELWEKLSYLKDEVEWHRTFDPNYELDDDLWNVSCILHETIGHGSGRADFHIFAEGDPLVIEGKEYKVGDKLRVTSKNFPQFMFGYANAIEEMRAEIISLYVSVYHFEDLLKMGLMERWTKVMTHEQIMEQFILHMAGVGLRRYLQQSDTAKEITGAHALANCTILHYLVSHEGIELVSEIVAHEGKERKVVGLRILELNLAKNLVKALMMEVQQIKSMANGLMAKKLIESYGKKIFFPQELKNMKDNQKLIIGSLKGVATLYPVYQPIRNETGDVIDVTFDWPADIFDQHYKSETMLHLR